MVDIKLYTVKDLREWLEHNHPAEGLSEQVIAPTRAWAIIHNPYVKDDDAIVVAIFEDGQLAAYTASFPDMLDDKRIWWASTLYCYPQFAGRGYGMIVVGSLVEAHEPDLTYDRWGASETVEIFNHFGHQTIYTPRYHLSFKKIDTSSLKGKLASYAQEIKRCMHPWPKPSKTNYTLRYASYIDGEAYAFMQAHQGNDLWLREQDVLNWILRYPFRQESAILHRTEKDLYFTSYGNSFAYLVVKVYTDNRLIGVYVLRRNGDTIAIVYIYWEAEYRDIVFDSMIDHLVTMRPNELILDDKELCAYVRVKVYFPKYREEQASFSVPADMTLPAQYTLQLGDGDSFI